MLSVINGLSLQGIYYQNFDDKKWPTTRAARSSATVEIARDAETTIYGYSRSSVVAPIDATYV